MNTREKNDRRKNDCQKNAQILSNIKIVVLEDWRFSGNARAQRVERLRSLVTEPSKSPKSKNRRVGCRFWAWLAAR